MNDFTGHLSPKPDPTTGEPHPPTAPREWHGTPGEEEQAPRRAGEWPRDEGPLLECYTPSRRNRIASTLGAMAMMAAGITLVNVGFQWITEWFAWVFVVGFGAIGYATVTGGTCAAGAEWFFHSRHWVRQYELSSIKVRMRFSKRYLHLVDRGGRKLAIFIGDAQENQRLWDLVYNGIRHSVANGAETNWIARRALKLHDLAQ